MSFLAPVREVELILHSQLGRLVEARFRAADCKNEPGFECAGSVYCAFGDPRRAWRGKFQRYSRNEGIVF